MPSGRPLSLPAEGPCAAQVWNMRLALTRSSLFLSPATVLRPGHPVTWPGHQAASQLSHFFVNSLEIASCLLASQGAEALMEASVCGCAIAYGLAVLPHYHSRSDRLGSVCRAATTGVLSFDPQRTRGRDYRPHFTDAGQWPAKTK